MTSGASTTRFPPTWGNDSYCMEWIDPHRGVSCGSLLVVGSVKGLKQFYRCLEEELLSLLNCEWGTPKFLRSGVSPSSP